MAEENKMLAVLSRNATEQIQVAIKEYRGHKYLDLRIFYTTDEGQTWLPTKKGVTVSAENLVSLKEAVCQAIEELVTTEENGAE